MKFRTTKTLLAGLGILTSLTIPTNYGECGCHVPTCDEFITGGGWIITPSGDKGNFGLKGGVRATVPDGAINYIDHGTGLHISSHDVIWSQITGPNSRFIDFQLSATDTARVFVTDNGEPGRDDTFEIQVLTNGNIVYQAGGSLGGNAPGGGNIQLHKEKCD